MKKECWSINIAKKVLHKALIKNNWNISQTARRLNMSRMTVYRMIKKFNFRKEHKGKQ